MKSITERTAFGHRLVQARKYAKTTQVIAAKAAKMSQGTLGELEREGLGSSYTPQLAAFYGVDPVWLATGKGEMVSKSGPQAEGVTDDLFPKNLSESLTTDELIAALIRKLADQPDSELDLAVSTVTGMVKRAKRQTDPQRKAG